MRLGARTTKVQDPSGVISRKVCHSDKKAGKQEAFMTSTTLRGGILAVVCGACIATAAVARSPHDGSWSVIFYTRSGACDATYRSGVIIQNGVIYPEAGGINFNGSVSSNGAVRASVSAGDQYASGSGRLGPLRVAASGGVRAAAAPAPAAGPPSAAADAGNSGVPLDLLLELAIEAQKTTRPRPRPSVPLPIVWISWPAGI
jgi:hypothetical protein